MNDSLLKINVPSRAMQMNTLENVWKLLEMFLQKLAFFYTSPFFVTALWEEKKSFSFCVPQKKVIQVWYNMMI